MEIIVADHAGFCFGVKNAINMAIDAQKNGSVSTLGELIHNSEAIGELERRGIWAKEKIDDIDTCQVVIRAHGASPKVFHALALFGYKVIDATCPFVKRVQHEAKLRSEQGTPVVLIGDRMHPEVIATFGWSDEKAHIVDSFEDIGNLPEFETVCVLGQTTYSVSKRDELFEAIRYRVQNVEIFDFICATTQQRQREAAEISAKADAVIVIGDNKSANTEKLAQVAHENCGRVVKILQRNELNGSDFLPWMTVGILAGASTPPSTIKDVVDFLKTLDREGEIKDNNA